MSRYHPMPDAPRQLLPREAYISEEWLDIERKHLFSNTWKFAGMEADLPNAGDFLTLNAGTYPLAVVRDRDGTLRAFHNLCRHRGTELLEGKGCAGKTIVCPYHRWVYNLDGRLRGLPNQQECFPDLDKSQLGLFAAAIGVYRGMIFVHPKENPQENFEDWLSTLPQDSWPEDISFESLIPGEEAVYEMKCNWKVFYENAIDGYHLAYLHEKTLGDCTPSQNVWEVHGRHVTWYSTQRDGAKHALPEMVEKYADKFRTKKVKGMENGAYPGVIMMFPTTIITPNPYGITVSELLPVTPEVTLLKGRNWSPEGSMFRQSVKDVPGFDKASGMIKSSKWEKHPLETLDFQTEDVWVCEKMQRSLKSPRYEVGPLARGAGAEAPLMHFQQNILDFVPLEQRGQTAE